MSSVMTFETLRGWNYQLTDHEARCVREIQETHDAARALVELSRFGNGFVREAAVERLAGQASSEALVALLERLNDWVPQVRLQAQRAVEQFLVAERAELLLQALAPLLSLGHKQRVDHRQTLLKARSLLSMPQMREQVESAFGGCRGEAGRFLFDLLLENAPDRPAFLAAALAHEDVTVRQKAVSACADLSTADAVPLLERVLQSSAASLRVQALRGLLTLLSDPAGHVKAALLDGSSAVRCLARWAAPRYGVDSQQVLLARLTGALPVSRREWLGLLGLAKELNHSLPDSVLRAALDSPVAVVRVQALQSQGDAGLRQQLAALDDHAEKVFRCAVQLLSHQPWSLFDVQLEQRLDDGWQELSDERRAALLGLKPVWRQLDYLLCRYAQASDEADCWLKQIAVWCDAQYTLVDPVTPKAHREVLLQRLQAMEDSDELKSGTVRRLR
ncbi:HEAT repeat domain-containing protein [Pseudomonas viridiflava]|uniref:HEAT repeat domain-containing protein n=1 Tax=Pseudomonas viridiflava TaxID=33069 RepID=UPI0013C36F62|nr:PBS lyase [Pseudomonas viridiflava]